MICKSGLIRQKKQRPSDGKSRPSYCRGTSLPTMATLARARPRLRAALPRGARRDRTGHQPTYTIVNEYLSGRMPLFHFDMYRLDSADDLFDIGWEDYLARGGVCAVEWSENVEEALSGAIRITIHKDPGGRECPHHHNRRRRAVCGSWRLNPQRRRGKRGHLTGRRAAR